MSATPAGNKSLQVAELPYVHPEHRLLDMRFRQYPATEPGSAETAARKNRHVPAGAFTGRHRRKFNKDAGIWEEHIEELFHGTMRVTSAALLVDVDDTDTDESGAPAARGRPGRILDKIITVQYLPDSEPGPVEQVTPVRISDHELRDLRNPQWPSRLGIHGHYRIEDLKSVVNVISAMARSVPERKVYAKTGVLRRPGKPPVWLRFGGPALMPTGSATVTDETAWAELPPEYETVPVLRELSYSLPSTDTEAAGDLAALYSAQDVYPDTPELPVVMTAVLFWAPFSSDLGRVTDILFGDSGEAGKTSFADALIVAAQSATHLSGPHVEGVVFNCRNKGTGLGIDQAMHPARGAVVVADDIITRNMSPQDLTKALTKLDAILDGIATGSGSPRGGYSRGRATFSVNKAPTGCGLVTAEDIPGEDRLVSPMGRAAVVPISNPSDVSLWSKNLTAVQEHSREIARAYSRFIADHLEGMPEAGRAALEELRPVVMEWLREFGGHKRTVNTYARLAVGWVLGARHEARLTGCDPAGRIAYGLAHLKRMFAAQAARSGKVPGERPVTDQAELWVRMVHRVLGCGQPGVSLAVADPELAAEGTHQPPQAIPPAQWPALGWRARVMGGTVREVVWEPVSSGKPVGAALVYDPEAGGRRPCFDMRLMLLPADFDRLTEAAAALAMRGTVPLTLAGGPVLRDKLAAAKVLLRKDAEKQNPIWAESKQQRRFVVNLEPILAGTLSQADTDPAEPARDPDACVLCGEPVGDRAIRDEGNGEPWHPWCAEPAPEGETELVDEHLTVDGHGGEDPHLTVDELAPQPETPPAARRASPQQARAAREQQWAAAAGPGTRRAPARRAGRDEMPLDQRLAMFTRDVRADKSEDNPGRDASDQDIRLALHRWEKAMDPFRYEAPVHKTGVVLFHWLESRNGSSPDLPIEDSSPHVAGLSIHRRLDVVNPEAIREDLDWITTLDVNAQQANAAQAACLPMGTPQWVTGQDALTAIPVKESAGFRPGYVSFTDPASLPAPFNRIPAGRFITTHEARLLAIWHDRGRCQLPQIDRALLWPAIGGPGGSRRWLRTTARFFLDGRERLSGQRDLPGRIALRALKTGYAKFFGGMLASGPEQGNHNRTKTQHYPWRDMVHGNARFLMWLSLGQADRVPALVYDPDAAYFLVGAEGEVPGGITVDDVQPGKWKVVRDRVFPATGAIREAIATGTPSKVHELILAEAKARKGDRTA